MSEEFLHDPIGEENRTISGWYMAHKEFKLNFNGDELLVVIGAGVIDNSCCGVGGCSYALIPGYIKKFKYRTDPETNQQVSTVEHVSDENDKKEIERLIKQTDYVTQVIFMQKV